MTLTDREGPAEFLLALGPANDRLSLPRIGEVGQNMQRMGREVGMVEVRPVLNGSWWLNFFN